MPLPAIVVTAVAIIKAADKLMQTELGRQALAAAHAVMERHRHPNDPRIRQKAEVELAKLKGMSLGQVLGQLLTKRRG